MTVRLPTLARGARVTVSTDRGPEPGVVLARAANPVSYLVRFADRTEAWFGGHRVKERHDG